MQLLSFLLGFSIIRILAAAVVPGSLTARAIGSSCITPNGAGTCQNTADCTTQGFSVAGNCTGTADVQCCVKQSCTTSSGEGICMNTYNTCGGSFFDGVCAGDGSNQCCAPSAPASPTSSASPAPTSPGPCQAIVDAAVKEEGIPYHYGGGGCSGPSGGGFDCSGLTQYAVCQALHITIPRRAIWQYQSGLGRHIPRSQARPGDMIFWATGGDCANAVAHVGIFMRPGWMVNAARTGTPVREQKIWLSYGGESICPDAVRFC